jgi:hypothetical protein
MNVTVTISEGSCLHNARVYYTDDELNLELYHVVSYEQGMEDLRKLEKILKKPARLIINQFNAKIAYKELSGYIDRE